jgi:DNA-binding response OmpR family regulator
MIHEPSSEKKILMIETVEDDTSIREVLRDRLDLEGFQVLEAKDGEEGLSTAVREHPDLILLDILMPKMNGIDMMKKVRESGAWGKNVPIILLTNISPDDEAINKAITENEPAYYLVKSNWSIEELVKKINERLSRK